MRFLREEAGVEPTALKIMAGVILLAIGLGIGVAVYKTVGSSVTAMKVDVSLARSSTTIESRVEITPITYKWISPSSWARPKLQR